ncbi:ABC transporter permease [Streptomyces melanosporofaciens]|uniref:ABC transporter permease n=1 Tax=Streptomyces melanosporofaciens TaxID=67327 RepID=UPI001FCA955F|nr:ABC transporter permease [Streptomyces melanosporofaciens]
MTPNFKCHWKFSGPKPVWNIDRRRHPIRPTSGERRAQLAYRRAATHRLPVGRCSLRARRAPVHAGPAVLKLLGHRLLWSLPVVFVATALSFVLTSVVPGDAAQMMLGPQATSDQIVALRQSLGLDKPMFEQYGSWLAHAVHGDLGTSTLSGEGITSQLNEHLEVTFSLLILGTLASAVLGLALGITSAVRGGVTRSIVDVLSLGGMAIPNFWLAVVLTSFFSVTLRLLPVAGYVSFADSPGQWARSLVLPVTSLAIGGATIIAKQTRDSLGQVLGQDFIKTLRANGLAHRSILFRHALRNAGVPIMSVIGVVFVGLIGGTIFVEQVFAMPGLGSIVQQATASRDVPVIQGAVVYFTLLVVAANLLVDLCYGAIDPRVRVR